MALAANARLWKIPPNIVVFLLPYTSETQRADRTSYADLWAGILASGTGGVASERVAEVRGRGEGGGVGGRGETEGGGIRGEWTTPCYQLGASRLPKPTNYYIPTIAILVPNQASYRTPVSLRVLCSRKGSPPPMMVHSMEGHRRGLRRRQTIFYSVLNTSKATEDRVANHHIRRFLASSTDEIDHPLRCFILE